MSGWGPQSHGYATLPGQMKLPVLPAFWVAMVASIVVPFAVMLPISIGLATVGVSQSGGSVLGQAFGWFFLMGLGLDVVLVVGGFLVSRRHRRDVVSYDGRRGYSTVGLIVWLLLTPWACGAYFAGYGLGIATARFRVPRARRRPVTTSETLRAALAEVVVGEVVAQPSDALAHVQGLAVDNPWGKAGGHVGWYEGRYLSANPRGGVLVIGAPGSGKSSAFLIPSVVVAPGACVASSIKGDVMEATARIRTRLGRVWHFDPGGQEPTIPGVQVARWSPLVSIHSWEDARRMGNRMAEPMRKAGGEGNGAHFIDRARDWLEVLMYAAVLGGHPIAKAADWSSTATDMKEGGTVEQVISLLVAAEERGDRGAGIARIQLQGLLALDDRERSGISSSVVRMMRLYGSVVARDLGETPNFDPVAFVRSSDTLYVTASPERQQEYAPLIASLLEEIRFATYARHAAEETGREPKRPHVTFVLDEANNTAPIPLPAIISEAGGQSLHVVVGIQDLSRARARWGQEADGFLTLFPTKLVLPGLVEPYTLDALSNAAGEYDRQMVGFSESTAYVGQHGIPTKQTSPTYSVQRQKVLHQGDIANLPQGTALLWEGATWHQVQVGMHWQHPTWRRVIEQAASWDPLRYPSLDATRPAATG